MEKLTLAETIKSITRDHLENGNGLLFGQCVSAVGWVNGTVPDCKNIVELPMTDVAGAGFAVGAAIAGFRPIFVLRFQDFFTLNCNQIVHYAALSKELHKQGIPIFVRCIGTDGAGPVHSIVLHNIPMYFPGMAVFAPMTPSEYRRTWDFYMRNDIPMFVSEHRSAYGNYDDWEDDIIEDADITLFGISDARREMVKAGDVLRRLGYKVSIIHIMVLKPLDISILKKKMGTCLRGLVIDNGFPICGAARDIAYLLMEDGGKFVRALACEDKTKCFNTKQQNRTPNADLIVEMAIEIIGKDE